MKNLLLSSFICLLFFSACNLGHYGKLAKVENSSEDSLKSIFGNNFNSFLFKTYIVVYGKNYSGLLVTKQIEPNDYRIIFTTELGMKLFDFEFKDTTFTLHYCVPQFNNPRLLKVIQKDFQIILMNEIKDKKIEKYIDSEKKFDIYKLKSKKMYNYYFVNKESKNIDKIEHSKKRVKKTTFTLHDYENGFPNTILIKHHDIKLMIELISLKK